MGISSSCLDSRVFAKVVFTVNLKTSFPKCICFKMPDYPFAYEKIAPTTWAYFSSLLMLALFFKFNRFWSVRNFDLVLIILLAPGIILIDFGKRAETDQLVASVPVETSNDLEPNNTQGLLPANPINKENPRVELGSESTSSRGQIIQRVGYCWLLSVSLIFLIRTLIDPFLVRRPLLAPNLSIGGLVFLMCSLMTFLYANILTAQPTAEDLAAAKSSIKMIKRQVARQDETKELEKRGPGLPLFQLFPIIPTFSNGQELLEANADEGLQVRRYAIASKSLAIFSQSMLVLGLILIGHIHFSNARVGFGMASVYLLLPYTAQFMGHVSHVLPGAMLVWAVFCFRRPWLAGIFIGLASGSVYYPIFLLPLWISFYWERGVRPFVGGVVLAITVCIASLALTSSDTAHFAAQLRTTFGFWVPKMEGLDGIWGLGWDAIYRIPILVAFVSLCVSFVFWPSEKNLGTLFAYTAAIMLGVQFWHGFEGGLMMAWFLPSLLLTIFRPNTIGRDAKSELKVVPATS